MDKSLTLKTCIRFIYGRTLIIFFSVMLILCTAQKKAELEKQLQKELSASRCKGQVACGDGEFHVKISFLRQKDLLLLSKYPITELVAEYSDITDLTPLSGLPLNTLVIVRVRGLPPLKGIENLPRETLQGLTLAEAGISDISALKSFTNLLALGVSNCEDLSDISPISNLSLKILDLNYTAVSNISALQGMPLTHLYIKHTSVDDLSPLAGMCLQTLYASNTKVSSLEPLRGMPIKYLQFSGTPVSNVSPLVNMPLNIIHLDDTKVSDVSPLSSSPLVYVSLTPINIVKGLDSLCDINTLQNISTGSRDTDYWSVSSFRDKFLPKTTKQKTDN